MDHVSGTDQPHPLRRTTAEVSGLVKDVEDVDPVFMSAPDRAAVLAELAALEDRLHLLGLRVMGASGDLAAEEGFKDVAAWQQAAQHRDGTAARRDLRLAEALGERWRVTAAGVREGRVSLEQARRIVRALDDLAHALETERAELLDHDTDDTDDTEAERERADAEWVARMLARAEARLVELAADHTPLELDRLGEGILTLVAPEHAEELERRALERAEARASSRTRLSATARGDGTYRISSIVPAATWAMLKTYLGALTSPRLTTPSDEDSDGDSADGGGPGRVLVDPWLDPRTGRRVPQEHRWGQAFTALVERVTTLHLPQHGGLGASVLVTIDLDSLRQDLGRGTIGDPDGDGVAISPGQVRRLACATGVLPVVLGGESVPLNVGRTSRLFTSGQRKGHAVLHPVCETAGCTVQAAWCEAHHKRDPWGRDGTTNRHDLAFLCPWHHHRAHDPAYRTTWSHDGARFHRRR